MDYQAAIYRFCNYQERCHQEVRDKLYALGAYKEEVERLIAELIEANLLNEERFARNYARGKFRMLAWGRIKIRYRLKAMRVSEYCIKQGLSEIDPDAYISTLQNLANTKYVYYKAQKPEWKRLGKLRQYLIGHGYEASMIDEALKTISLSSK